MLYSIAALIIDPQSNAAVDRAADRLRAKRTVDEEVGDPAIGNADDLILDHDRFADARLRVSGIDCKPCSPAGQGERNNAVTPIHFITDRFIPPSHRMARAPDVANLSQAARYQPDG